MEKNMTFYAKTTAQRASWHMIEIGGKVELQRFKMTA